MSVEEIREQLTLALEQYDPAKHAGYLFHELRNDICEYHIILRTKNRNGWKKALVALKERINSLQRVFIGIFGIGGNDYTRVRVNALIMKFLVAVFEDLIASGCENAKDPRAIRYVKALTLATGEIPSRDANGNLGKFFDFLRICFCFLSNDFTLGFRNMK